MQNPNQMISKTMIYDEVAMALQGSGLTEKQIQGKGRGYAESLRLVSLPQVAGLGIKLRPEKARYDRQRAGTGP